MRAYISIASNPVLSSPNGERLAKALDGLDFMLSLDLYLNETTRHADVILPGQSPLEHSHYDVAFPQLSDRNHARWSGPVFEPAPGHLPEWQLLLKLASRAQDIFVGSEVEQKRLLIKTVLSNLKITDGKLDYELKEPFETIAKCADHSEWRPQRDSNPCFRRERAAS